MTTLKQAQQSGNLEKFIEEHEQDAPGNQDKLKATVKNLALDIRTQKIDTNKGKTTPKG